MQLQSIIRSRNILFACLAVLMTFMGTAGQAAGQVPANGLAITPAVLNVELSDSRQQYVAQLSLTNHYTTALTLRAELRGIDEQNGNLIPFGSVKTTLRESIRLPANELTIKPEETAIFPLTFINTPQLEPGGHYATLVFTQKPDSKKPGTLYGSVSVATYVIKRGGDIEKLSGRILPVKHNWFRMPNSVAIDFNNEGNVHVVPRAAVSVRTSDVEVYASGVANQQSLPLLPGKTRRETATLTPLQRRFWPAKLQVNVRYRSGQSDTFQEYNRDYWYVSPVFVLLITVTVIGVIVAIVKRHRLKQWTKKCSIAGKRLLARLQQRKTSKRQKNKTP